MKLIIKIAKNELRNLFYSPVAWFTIVVFFVMCGYYYTSSMYGWAKSFNDDHQYNPYAELAVNVSSSSITGLVFPAFFNSILQYLYLYIPLITMSIISREYNNGTVKLLYSSPVKLYQVVIGKYLGLMIFNLAYVFILGFFIAEGFIDIKSLDYGPLLSATFGIYLLLCALTAIGLFMSSLTAYPVISAIAGFTLLFLLKIIGGLWQQYDIVRDITYFLSINNRTEWMITGLVRSKDVIYYLIIIYLFVGFTLLKLRSGREISTWYVKTARYLTIIMSGLLIGYISSRHGFIGYLDVTERKTNTIRPETQEILRELGDSTLQVTVYANLLDPSNNGIKILPVIRNRFLDMWEQYTRFKPNIKFRYEYYYKIVPGDNAYYKIFPGKTPEQIAGLIARGNQLDSTMFKSPGEMSKLIDLEPEGYKSVMQLSYNGRKTFLRVLPSQFEELDALLNQTHFNAAFKRLLGTKMPKLAFITGELERSITKKGEREYSGQYNLINLGFDFDTINLLTQDIAPDVTTVILADPKMDLSPVALGKLRSYLENGGNMLVLGEPKKQHIVNQVLQQLGIQLMPGQLVRPTVNDTPDKITSFNTPFYFNLGNDYWSRYCRLLWHYNAYFEDISKIDQAGVVPVASIVDSGFVVEPLFLTKPWTKKPSNHTWLKAGELVNDSSAPVFNPHEGDIKQDSFVTALQLTRKVKGKEQRIIVSGDADIMSNAASASQSEVWYSWLNDNRFPIYTPIPFPPKDNRILISNKWAATQKIIYVWLLPAVLLIAGTLLLIRRKRS